MPTCREFQTVQQGLMRIRILLVLVLFVAAGASALAQEKSGDAAKVLALEKKLLEIDLRATPTPTDPSAVKIILHDVARPPCHSPNDALRPFTDADEVRIFLEGFYYNASRVRDLFRDSQGLPGLKGFEAAGVRDVRNHLVEHPTRKMGVRIMSIALGGPVGPQLKPVRRSGDPPGTFDAGLHVNAREFCAALETTLTAALRAGAA